eukprot:scaffold1245_cov252-Pinguiococcus_pyrenoidosus.AAC.20
MSCSIKSDSSSSGRAFKHSTAYARTFGSGKRTSSSCSAVSGSTCVQLDRRRYISSTESRRAQSTASNRRGNDLGMPSKK